jgi:hypothetical protein
MTPKVAPQGNHVIIIACPAQNSIKMYQDIVDDVDLPQSCQL